MAQVRLACLGKGFRCVPDHRSTASCQATLVTECLGGYRSPSRTWDVDALV